MRLVAVSKSIESTVIMWRSISFRRSLLQLFDSRSRPWGGGGTTGASAASEAAPFLELGARGLSHFAGGAVPRRRPRPGSSDLIFMKREVLENVADRLGTTAADFESRGLDDHDAKSIAQSSLEVCSNQTLTLKTRHQAIETISRLAKHKPGSLDKYELVNPILQVMFPLLAESTEEDEDYMFSPHVRTALYHSHLRNSPRVAARKVTETTALNDLPEGVFSPRVAAREVIEILALNHPEQVFSPVLEFASTSSQDTNPRYREAAVSVLGDIAEGCSRLMKGELEVLVPLLLGAHGDAEPTVRAAAAYALRQFAGHLQPEVASQHQSVLPCIVKALDDDGHDIIKPHSYDSLVALCDNMTREEILPFLDPIMNKLFSELQCRSGGRQLKLIDALISAAAAAGQDFAPYAERVLESMKPLLVRNCFGVFLFRTRDFVFAGELATTMGRAGAEPLLAPYIEAAISDTADRLKRNIRHLRVRYFVDPGYHRRGHIYSFFCNAAETLGDGFAQYLPRVVPLAISSCNLDEGSATAQGELAFRSIDRTKVLDEKAAATQALGFFAIHTKSAFAPFLEESMSVMINQSAHHHEDVRLQGVIGLKNVLTAAQAVSKGHSDGAAKAKEVIGTVMNIYTKAMVEDRDRRVVAQVCTNTVDIIKDFEYAAWEPYMPQIFDSASQLLEKQSARQRHDETVTAAVTNLLQALTDAKAAGSSTTSDHAGC